MLVEGVQPVKPLLNILETQCARKGNFYLFKLISEGNLNGLKFGLGELAREMTRN
jgi:hypothetical protein